MQLTSSIPPYLEYRELSSLEQQPGQVIIAVLDVRELGLSKLVQELRALRGRAPWADLLLCLRGEHGSALNILQSLAVQATGACACTSDAAPSRGALVRLISEDEDATSVLVNFLTRQAPRLDNQLCCTIHRIVRDGSAVNVPEPHCRRFRRLGIPRPDAIARAHRALQAVVQLRRQGDLSVLSAALYGGFSDGASLTRSCHRLFGKPPSLLRLHASSTWALWSWWSRHC